LKELDVALTDGLLAGETFLFAFLLSKRPAGALKGSFLNVFIGSGSAAAAGAVYHGFAEPGTAAGDVLSWVILLSLGLAARGFALIGARLSFDAAAESAFRKALPALGTIYVLGLVVKREFWMALLLYVPATLLALRGFIKAYRVKGRRRFLAGIAGLILSLAAAVVQRSGLSSHALGLTHNALYHLILMGAFGFFFMGAGGVLDGSD
jgi:hypothetical protein